MTTSEHTLVRSETADGFATLTLDSPHNRNALSPALIAQLRAGLQAAGEDPSVRAVVLTHAGKTFCAGADLASASGEHADFATHGLGELLRQILELPKPVIAAVDGHVRGGGMGLVAAADIAVAGPNASFALPEAKLGVAPAVISLTVLPRLDFRSASRYFLTGETFGSGEAQRIGLITAAEDNHDEQLAAFKAALLKASPQGLAESKRLVNAQAVERFRDLPDLAALSARLFQSEEAREGVTAFLRKREPRWAM
ncbi:Enoyl-CoA hydratase/isomerase [Segniliparus rotundus DSM 44985]|uniref:Enoyl-CoA hydratase/isomerase n=1 Tax=Segniliparus rotundus (strain ATCC BAA-972 / CDC 1076 / CIP 108378 / DSM 44985 / JCM 13578) TaxID=640132 RepID=D6ZAW8_SEGRD|nr:enoyl-CoA hydratase family protein [Segniliparus rotundus]ADG98854.1 Enoyl-CoA hydratase/isomerase [Segniliparus rotundus DSM 44985]